MDRDTQAALALLVAAGDGADPATRLAALVTPWLKSKAAGYARRAYLNADDLFTAGLSRLVPSCRSYDPEVGSWKNYFCYNASRAMMADVRKRLADRERCRPVGSGWERPGDGPGRGRTPAPGRSLTDRAAAPLALAPDRRPSADPARDLTAAERLAAAVRLLPFTSRLLVRIVHGLGRHRPRPLPTAARLLGVPRDSAERRYARAVARLRELLADLTPSDLAPAPPSARRA